MTEKRTRRKFSKEYKLDVITQSYQRDNIKELADELGLRPELIYRWRTEYKEAPEESFPG
ncbi:IS3 family transposase, partial [Aliifodinibius salipaludis]